MWDTIRTTVFLFASLLALTGCDLFEKDPWEKSAEVTPPVSAPLKLIANIKPPKLPSDPALVSSSAYSSFVREGCFRWNGSTLSNAFWLDDTRVMARGRFAEIKGALADGNSLCAHIWTAEFDNNHVKPALVTVQNGSAFQFLYAKGGGRYQFLQRPKHHVVLLLRQALTETSPTSIEEAVIEDGHLDIYANPNNYREAAAWLVRKGEQNNQPLPLRIPLKSWDEGGEKRWTAPPLTAQFHAYKKAYLLTPTDTERWQKKPCIPAWWLWLSSETDEICIPPWLKDKATGKEIYPLIKVVTRVGAVFQIHGTAENGAGIYFLKNLRPEIILVGEEFDDPAVSPDGCKIVFNYKQDASSNDGALVSVDVCRKFLAN